MFTPQIALLLLGLLWIVEATMWLNTLHVTPVPSTLTGLSKKVQESWVECFTKEKIYYKGEGTIKVKRLIYVVWLIVQFFIVFNYIRVLQGLPVVSVVFWLVWDCYCHLPPVDWRTLRNDSRGRQLKICCHSFGLQSRHREIRGSLEGLAGSSEKCFSLKNTLQNMFQIPISTFEKKKYQCVTRSNGTGVEWYFLANDTSDFTLLLFWACWDFLMALSANFVYF